MKTVLLITMTSTYKPKVDRSTWNNMPAWARYMAMDSNGNWYWFTHKPIANSFYGTWRIEGTGNHGFIPNEYAPQGFNTGDWENSLVKGQNLGNSLVEMHKNR